MRVTRFFALAFLLSSPGSVLAQDQPRLAPDSSQAPEVSIEDIIQETQQAIRGKNRTGVVIWMPVEFWEASMRQQGMPGDPVEQFKALRDYTMVIVAGGNISGLGHITWLDAKVLRSSVRLKDAAGNLYEPHRTVSGDAAIIAGTLRPVLANAIGAMGEHMEVFMFPARDAAGKAIADPTQPGSFSIILNEIPGFGASSHDWRLPLTSLSPPKFCPVGSERLQANWKFCPWHGVSL
jgi:hypothetical protein